MSITNNQYHCEVCKKTYANEKTFQSHLKRSEKHKDDNIMINATEFNSLKVMFEKCKLETIKLKEKIEELILSHQDKVKDLSQTNENLKKTIKDLEDKHNKEKKVYETKIFDLKCVIEHKTGAIETLESIIKDLNEEKASTTYNTVYRNETYIQNSETGEFIKVFSDSDSDFNDSDNEF